MTEKSLRSFGLLAASLFATALAGPAALADSAGITLSEGDKFGEKSGEELYASVCAACHMDQGQGATGAGNYPALAGNENLAAGSYPVYVVLHGFKNMPAVGQMMSDEQVAAVVNYVRTHFGNDYQDAVKPEDVAASR
ncbi:cytochrome c [Chelativorans sp. M5D2P16]|uniref:c-type cytochrome n=1 Tax=Chelativorans sp. M5D2P16 TaxID=3095678 RepID=UPI002ACA3810|nr:cytochrome c [Chelativorans sp. M5D2P16]MDZ5699420.1 cytochrome c [Chelativorans sp. M5D2P16]